LPEGDGVAASEKLAIGAVGDAAMSLAAASQDQRAARGAIRTAGRRRYEQIQVPVEQLHTTLRVTFAATSPEVKASMIATLRSLSLPEAATLLSPKLCAQERCVSVEICCIVSG
jgi:hypothetical protein